MIVKLLIKKSESWSGVYLYKGCFKGIGPYWTRSGRRYTGLSEADARRLEKEIGYQEGYLNPESSFWNSFFIKIDGSKRTKTGDPIGSNIPYIEIDTTNPHGELQYLHCLEHKLVAKGKLDTTPGTEYILINEDEEARKANIESKKRREASREFEKLTLEDMRKALRLFGRNSDLMSNEIVEETLYSIVMETPESFMSKWVNNKQRNTQFLIEAAVAKNIIRKSRNVYYYGTEVIGTSLLDAAANLDDKKNSDIKASIEDELKSKQ